MTKGSSDTPAAIWAMGMLWAVFMLVACAAGSPDTRPDRNTLEKDSTETSIILNYGEGAQVELIGPLGRRVFIDVTDTSMISAPPTDQDILLTTHLHNDHYLQSFVDGFPGEQLFVRQGEIIRPGLMAIGLAAQHSEHEWDEPKPSGGTNYIFVVELAGLRIAHFGDIGQKRLTDVQLAALGRIDVAITQFINSYSQMNLENLKGYHLMEQLRPRIILPHHGASNEDAIGLHKERWDVVCAPVNRLSLSRKMLPERTTVLLMGEMVDYLQKTFQLAAWP